MGDESIQKQSIQVVFLIDTLQFYENRENEKSLNKAYRAISTSVLRVLTYFVNRQDCDKAKFAWGCQFFRIPLNTHFYRKRSMFREFTRNAFFDFEKQLEEEINIASGKSSGKSKQKQKRGFEVSPAFSLKYALHDACLEYRWDELIISSPQKASKSRRERSNVKKDEHDQQQTKFVFAFLPCPISLYDLEQFCEHKSNFSTTYLKKTLINTGKQESHLFDLLKASLFWLDTRNLWESKQILTVTQSDLDSAGHQSDEGHMTNTDGLEILNDTLALLRGRVIPLGCLTYLGGYEVSSIDRLVDAPAPKETGKPEADDEEGKQKMASSHSQDDTLAALPYSSALDYYTKTKQNCCGLTTSSHFHLGENPEDREYSEMNIVLYDSQDESAVPACSLNIQLMWSCETSISEKTNTSDNDVDDVAVNDDDVAANKDDLTNTDAARNNNKDDLTNTDAACHNNINDDDDDSDSTSDVHELFHSLYDNLVIPFKEEEIDSEALHDESIQLVLDAIFEGQEMGDMNEEKIDASKASVMGIISRDFLSRDVCQSNHVYSCLGHEVSPQTADARKDGTGAVTSQWFQSMLSQLQKSNCIMILYLRKRLVVLEPLTSVLGSLRVLCSMSGKAKKKINAFDGVMSPPKMSRDEVSEEAEDEEGNILDELATHLQEETSQSKEEEEEKEATTDETSKECLLDLNFHKETNSLKSFTVSCLEPWYRDVPDRGVTAKFLERLVSLPENLLLDESINLSSALSQLKQLYKSGQKIPPSQETEKKRTEKKDKSNKLGRQAAKRKSKPIMKKLQARTLSIYEKSIQMVEKELPVEPRKPKTILKKGSTAIFMSDKEFSSVADLQTYVRESYDRAITNSTSFLACAQQIVFMTVHFMKEQEKDRVGDVSTNSAEAFLRGNIYNTNVDLVKKYQDAQLHNCRESRVREAKLQSLLRFEMEVASPTEVKVGERPEAKGQRSSDVEVTQPSLNSSADEQESELPEELQQSVDEISQLLCSIPLLADHDQLSSLLEDVIFPSYSDTIPYLVKAVYEELGHPVPKQLRSPASSKPSVRAPSSYKAVRSWGSHDPVLSVSTRSRSLSRHPSLADIGHKRMINVQPRRTKTKILSSKKEDTDKEARRAKRNLFSDGGKLPRRESVAVMEGISQPRRQSPRKHPQGGGAERAAKVLKTRTVRETPGKRQVSQAVLLNVNRARKLEARMVGENLSPMVEVIEESPVKKVGVSSAPRSFPRLQNRRLSFYSQNRLKDARRLSARITGSNSAEVPDITKTVEGKKSPARLFLKEVCTPSTLGSLTRLRSGKVTSDVEASPDLKSEQNEEQKNRRVKEAEDVRSEEIISPRRQTRSMLKQTPRKDEKETSADGEDGNQAGGEKMRLEEDGEDAAEMRTTRGERELSVGQKEQTPRKRTAVRTSLKKMFDGAAERALPRRDETRSETVQSLTTRKRKIENENTEATDVCDAIVDGDIEKEIVTPSSQETEKDGIGKSSCRSPSKKKRRTNMERKPTKWSEKNPNEGTPSPRRKVPELLASPEIFKQWPRRKLRSTTPSPNSRFLREQMAKKVRGSISESPEPSKNATKSAGRSLRRKSKTSLKFAAKDSDEKEGSQSPKSASKEEDLERHFSFHSDDDEIEFIKIDRTMSRDSLGRELSPTRDKEGDEDKGIDPGSSPVFNESGGSMVSTLKSPFKSPWKNLRRTPCKTKTPKGSGSPIFHYVSTPGSTGMKLTLTKQSDVPLTGGNSEMSSSTASSDLTSSAEDRSTSESILLNVSGGSDEVFASHHSTDSKPLVVSTPPEHSPKLTVKLSTRGLYDLLHSPFAGSPTNRLKSGRKNSRKADTS